MADVAAVECDTAAVRGRYARRPALSLALAAAVALVGGCSGHKPATHRLATAPAVVTPAQARAIVSAFWPKREAALAALDLSQVNTLEAGVADEVDTAITKDILGRTPRRNLATVRQHGPVMVFVPRQTRYPATFLGEVLTNRYGSTAPFKEVMVFRKTSPSDSWRLVLEVGSETATVDPSGMSAAFDAPLPHFTGVDVARLPAELPAYWQTWWTTMHAPNDSPFAPGYWTTQRGALIAESGGGRLSPQCHCFTTLRYRPYPQGGVYSFNTHSGGLLECFATTITATSTPPAGTALVQDLDRNNWGAPLTPGIYRRITLVTLRPSCVYANPPEGLPVSVLGGEDGTISVTGIPGCRPGRTPCRTGAGSAGVISV